MCFRFELRYVVLIVLITACPKSLHADDCKLIPAAAMRGQQISLAVPGLPAGMGTLRFQKFGSSESFDPSSAIFDKDTKPFSVPLSLPFGSYNVTAVADQKPTSIDQKPAATDQKSVVNQTSCGTLTVTPPKDWALKLFEFDPPGTYDTEKVFVGSAPAAETETVRVTLRGAGFFTDVPEDNRITMNGKPLMVNWKKEGGCDQPFDPGTKENPIKDADLVIGRVIRSDRIDLCRVSVRGTNTLSFAVSAGDLTPTESWTFRLYRWTAFPVGLASGFIALALALLVLGLVRSLKKAQPNPTDYNVLKVLFIDQETDTYSLSKFQFYWWTTASLFAYSYLVISKLIVQGQAWPDMPPGLPAIVGIGAATSVGSLVVTGIRGPKGGGPEKPSLGDLVTSGGAAAPDRVQMLVWTILGVGAFCLAVLRHSPGTIKELDPVPTGLMYMMGLSAAGYLGGKLARQAGPVINSITVTPQQSDDTFAKATAPPPPPPPAFATPVAQANAVLASLTNIPAGSAQNAVNGLSAGIAEASKVKTLADAQAAFGKLKDITTEAEKQAKAAADAFALPGAQPDAGRGAEIAQKATGALHDLMSAVSTAVGSVSSSTTVAARPSFTRQIELRGRNLSNQAMIEIDAADLPFRMLVPNSDTNGERLPEIVVREPDDPNLAMILRLTIDPSLLEDPDFQLYKRWFGLPTGTSAKRTLSLTNLDGQKSEMSFAVD